MAGIIGYGTEILYSNTNYLDMSPEQKAALSEQAYTSLTELVDITPPEQGVNDVDVTHHGSASATKEYTPGLIEPGETGITLLYSAAMESALIPLVRVPKAWLIAYPNGSYMIFVGYVKKLGNKMPLGDKAVIEAAMKATGPSEWHES